MCLPVVLCVRPYRLPISLWVIRSKVHKFLDKHPDIPFSAAKFEYSLYLESEGIEYANAISEKMLGESEEDLHSKRMIEQAETTEELL